MRWLILRALSSFILTLLLAAAPAVYAQDDSNAGQSLLPSNPLGTTDAPPLSGFNADPSLPTPDSDSSPEPTVNNAPVSSQSESQWQTYDQPIRRCIPGDTIIPASGDDLFSYLFNNSAQADVSMSIQGWKGGRCIISFMQATNQITCSFSSSTLRQVMNSIIANTPFDPSSDLARELTESCQANTPAG